MHITTSNILLGTSPTVSTGSNPLFVDADTVDPDFSTFYTSSDNQWLTVDFGIVSNINYIAVAGINIEGNKDFSSRVSVNDGDTTIARNFVSGNNCVLLTFTERSFTNLRVVIYNHSGSTPPKVSFIAGGNAFEVPNNGEHAGYNRQFLNRNIKSKSTLNDIAAPVAFLTKKVTAKGTLTIPKMAKGFSEDSWQIFLDFAVSNYFFIREQDPLNADGSQPFQVDNNSAYLCFDLSNNKALANSQTRELNDMSISFKVFNGL